MKRILIFSFCFIVVLITTTFLSSENAYAVKCDKSTPGTITATLNINSQTLVVNGQVNGGECSDNCTGGRFAPSNPLDDIQYNLNDGSGWHSFTKWIMLPSTSPTTCDSNFYAKYITYGYGFSGTITVPWGYTDITIRAVYDISNTFSKDFSFDNCSGVGWFDAPFWGGCDDCTTKPVDLNNNCAPCGQAYAYCDGNHWDTNWNNHKCAGSSCVPTLSSCVLSANPSSGTVSLTTGLTATVNNSTTNDYYELFCLSSQSTPNYAHTQTKDADHWTKDNACTYDVANTYTAKARVTRSGTTVECTTQITATPPVNNPPDVPTLVAPPQDTWINYDPTFQNIVSDRDNDQVRGQIWIYDTGQTALSSFVDSGSTTSIVPVPSLPLTESNSCSKHTMPDGTISDGYWWTARARDEHGSWGFFSYSTLGWWDTKIDKAVPTSSISYSAGTINTASIPITLTEADSCSGIAEGDVDIRIKAPGGGWGMWQNYTSTIDDFTYTDIDEYQYKFRYRVKDNAGNWSDFMEGGEILVNLNSAPTASNLNVAIYDNCEIVPVYHFAWTYTDPDLNTQSRFDFQVDNNSDFSSPEVDTTVTGLNYPSPSDNSQAKTLITSATSPGCNYLTYNTTYYWRARVYDLLGKASSWTSGSSFTTLIHHYPKVDFSWTPTTPNVGETVNLTDASECYDESLTGSDCSLTKGDTYQWIMTDGTPNSATTENIKTKYPAPPGLHNISLQVTDSDARTCTVTKPIRINYPLPTWREIMPF